MKIFTLIMFCIALTIGCKSQNSEINKLEHNNNNNNEICPEISYSYYFASPHKIKSYYDFDEGLLCSKVSNKPYLVYFSGFGSVDSREMEATVWSDSVILNLLKTKFVIATLYTNNSSLILKRDKEVISQFTGDTLKNYGEKQRYIQKLKFKENKMPAYYILNSKEQILAGPYYFNLNIETFKKFLINGIESYSKNRDFK